METTNLLKQYNSVLEVDLDQFTSNINNLIGEIAPAKLIPVIKGDACGLGIVEIARTIISLNTSDSIPCLAVSHVSEGVTLRKACIEYPVLVLGALTAPMIDTCIQNNLIINIGNLSQIKYIYDNYPDARVDCHVAIDTGLRRNGINADDEIDKYISVIKKYGDNLNILGTYSHFADSTGDNKAGSIIQFEKFIQATTAIKKAKVTTGIIHIANSAATEIFPESNLDAVRVCRRLYFDNRDNPTNVIKEIATWKTSIINIKKVKSGEKFGYDNNEFLDHDTMIAIIGVGYADGLMHEIVKAHAPVLINGRRCRLLRMCMDCAFVELRNIDARIGDEVVLFGTDSTGNTLTSQEVAKYIDDEGCTLTSLVSSRVKRIYK